MKKVLDREGFRQEWKGLLVFLIIAGFIPFGMLIKFQGQTQAILLTIGLTLILGGAAIVFLRRENIRFRDIGLGKNAWVTSLIMFGMWWVLITGLDFVSSWVVEMSGSTMPREQIVWSPVVALDWFRAWIVVGLLEELAFRGYLHNKLIAVCRKKWIGIALAALVFGLWHIPASVLLRGNTVLGALPGALLFAAVSFLFFNVPYELTGLLPLMALFHGWSDFPLTMALQRPNAFVPVPAYVIFLFMVGIFAWKRSRQIILQKGAVYVS